MTSSEFSVEGTASVKDEMGGWQWIAGALTKALETKSSRDIAKETGLGHATICRISTGREPSVSSYFALVRWLRPSTAPEAQIEHMVNRFLQWKLPENFNPDAGVSFKREYNEHTPWPMKHEPVGTNLFDFEQATEMVRHMLEGMPLAAAPSRDQVSMGALREAPSAEGLREVYLDTRHNADNKDAKTLLPGLMKAVRLFLEAYARAPEPTQLHGPYGWLNGHRGLSEDSWTLDSDPLENSDEYFAVALYALTDPFKEIGKDAALSSLSHPSSLVPTAEQGVVEPRVSNVLSFVDGLFTVKADGSGDISFKDDDLEWGEGEDREFRTAQLDASEVIAIRDWLNQVTGLRP